MKQVILLTLTAFFFYTNGYTQTLSSPNPSNLILFNLNKKDNGISDKLATPKTLPVNVVGGVSQSSTPAEEKIHWLHAAEYAKNNTQALAQYLAIIKAGGAITLDINASSDPTLQNLSYIVLAIKTQTEIDKYFTVYKIANDDDKKDIQMKIQAINTVIESIGNPSVSIFATGDIVGTISSQNSAGSAQSTIGTGTVGLKYASTRDVIVGRVSVASSIDTITSNFGQSLLNPAKGKSGSAIFEWYRNLNFKALGNPWLHIYGSFANNIWAVDTGSAKSLYSSASTFGCGVLLYWPVVDQQIGSTRVGLSLEGGFSLRYLGGDIHSLLNKSSDSLAFLKVFPTTSSTFLGPEFGFAINVGQVTAALQAYYYIKGKNDQVDGLTGLQFSFGISINASIISK